MTRFRRVMALVSLCFVLAGPVVIAAQHTADVALRAAIETETVRGDVRGAIEQYKRIVETYGKNDRAMAARALLRLAEAYHRLGDLQAKSVYEQLVRDYRDQKDVVATALERLGTDLVVKTAGPASRRVWTMPARGEIFGGAVSPDGRFIPYVNWAPEHHGDLFVHDLASGSDRRLTDTAGPGSPSAEDQFAEETSFSRDGRQLAYTWFDGKKDRYEIRLMNLGGTGVPQFRRVFENPDIFWIAPYDWSPDGTWLAVSLQRRDRTAQIGLVAVQTGVLRVLKSVDWRGPSRMSFSADGRFLAYDLPAGETNDQRDIFVLAIDGSREAPAVVHPANDTLVGWSPDGKRLLFASDRSGTTGLWALTFADGKLPAIPEVLKREIGQSTALGVSASGALYSTVSELGSDIQIASLDFTTGQFLRPPVTAIESFVGSNRFPDWSPDGKDLAYISWRGGNRFVIGIRSIGTGDYRELSPPLKGLHAGGVRWSSDGRSLLGVGQDIKGRNGIFRIDVRTGETSIVVVRDRAGIGMPMESPDGKTLYYSIAGTSLMKRDLISGEETEFLRPPSRMTAMSLSPDGRYIVASTADSSAKANTLLVIAANSGEVKELMRRPQPQLPIVYTWAADSRSLLARIIGAGEKSFEIWRLPLDGSQGTKLEPMLDAKIGVIRLHPDGQQIAFQVNEPPKPTEVWVTENFLPLAKAGK